MSEWKNTNLGELCSDISYGYTASATSKAIGPKFLRITDIVPVRIDWDTVPYCETDKLTNEKYKLQNGDIVIARTGATTGYNKIIKKISCNAVFASYLIRYKIDENKAYSYYIGHILQSANWSDYVDAIVGGSAQPGANAKQLGSFEVSLPPLPEQKAIASVLSSLDDKIDLLHRQNKTLDAMAETLFRQWFVEEAQDDWEYLKLSEVLQTVLGGTPSTKNPEFWDGDIPWINSGEVNNFRIIKGSKHITELGLNKSNTKLLPKGTTVLAITGATLGQISLLEIETCANQSVVGIIPNDRIPKAFVYFWVKHKINKVMLCETGGAQPHINKNDINETEIVIPDKKRTQKVINFINPLFDKITANSFQILTLEKLRDTLLPKLMSGKVRVGY